MSEHRGENDATGSMLSSEAAVVALTRELTNYSERIAKALRCPVSELWGIFLAVTGRMAYVERTEEAATRLLGVLDARQRDGRTRFQIWEEALNEVLDILGDPEARYRTGYDAAVMRAAMTTLFDSTRRLHP